MPFLFIQKILSRNLVHREQKPIRSSAADYGLMKVSGVAIEIDWRDELAGRKK